MHVDQNADCVLIICDIVVSTHRSALNIIDLNNEFSLLVVGLINSLWDGCDNILAEKALKASFEQGLEDAKLWVDEYTGIYKNEAHIRENDLDDQQTLNYRHKHSEPVINAFFAWVYQQRQRTDFLPSDPLAYAHERQLELKGFLTNPHVTIDTNHLERALRVIHMGRKIR